MIWSTVKGAFMLQSSEIFVASGLLFPPSYILLDSRLGASSSSSDDQHEQHTEPIAFEIQVLETALSCVVTKFYKQLALVEPLLDGLIADATSQPTEIKVGRLAALKKSLFEYNQGVQAIIQAIRGLLCNNRDMADMYLGK